MQIVLSAVPKDKIKAAAEIIAQHNCGILGVIRETDENPIKKYSKPLQPLGEAIINTIRQGYVYIVYTCTSEEEISNVEKELDKLEQ